MSLPIALKHAIDKDIYSLFLYLSFFLFHSIFSSFHPLFIPFSSLLKIFSSLFFFIPVSVHRLLAFCALSCSLLSLQSIFCFFLPPIFFLSFFSPFVFSLFPSLTSSNQFASRYPHYPQTYSPFYLFLSLISTFFPLLCFQLYFCYIFAF